VFCISRDGCACPDGTVQSWWAPVVLRHFDHATFSFFGIYDLGPNEDLAPKVDFSAHAMETVTNELCSTMPPGPTIDPAHTKCDTWLSRKQVVSLVSGAHVATTSDPTVVTAETGATLVLCRWNVQRNPSANDPFFEWVVPIDVQLVMRGDEPPDLWEKRVKVATTSLHCAPEKLDNRIPACVHDRRGTSEVLVPMGANRYLELSLTSTTTNGSPDYKEIPQAARAVAASFADRLAP
jgi:hypothetical protein